LKDLLTTIIQIYINSEKNSLQKLSNLKIGRIKF